MSPNRPFGRVIERVEGTTFWERMMRLPLWLVIVLLVIGASIPALIFGTVIGYLASNRAVEQAAEDATRNIRRSIRMERERNLQRECETLRDRIDRSRASDIYTLAYISNLQLDLSGVPLPDNVEFALAITWNKAITAQAQFIQARVNNSLPIKCVRGEALEIPTAPVDLTGAPSVVLAPTTPTTTGGRRTGGGSGSTAPTADGGSAPAPAAPAPPAPPATQGCEKVNPQGKCTDPGR